MVSRMILTRILVNALAFTATAACATDLHIASHGDDANPGTSARPFATLARARDEVRRLKQAGPLREPVTVWVRGGSYSLSAGVKFEARDSGTATAPVT